MALMPVEDARQTVLAGAKPLGVETVALREADRRVLSRDLKARRDQPPFPASAMDGYAVRAADIPEAGSSLVIAGASAAGHGYRGALKAGQAIRIFTGAPVPKGADTVVLQEDTVAEGGHVRIAAVPRAGQSVRRRGLDFARGETVIGKNTRLSARLLGLAAAMNFASLPVWRRPRVALFTTGDELVAPGGRPGIDQIISSNSTALAVMIERAGADVTDLGIVPDTLKATRRAIARAADHDILITTGGASVGDHDFVRAALQDEGVALDFWKVAMRPGKPLMFGRRPGQRVLGLPGNPVSALVCAEIFLKPLIAALTGLNPAIATTPARAGGPLKANDQRQDFIRARLQREADGSFRATPFPLQDSSMQRTLAEAGCLILRAPFAPATETGAAIEVIVLED